ncbi:hypothetical protein MMC29_000476 [Sticta canariensis]|nr:hypothetical protein [Sticta canariensis]
MAYSQPSTPQTCPSIIENYPGTRLTTYSPRPFHQVTARLYRSICQNAHSSSANTASSATAADPPPSAWARIKEHDKHLQHMGRTVEQRREIFQQKLDSVLGPHGFMFFTEFNHGSWMELFDVPPSPSSKAGSGVLVEKPTAKPRRQCKRVILGNPMIALTMLQHDLDAGLAVPVELLLVEEDEGEKEGGTRIVYQLPSALISRVNTNPELRAAAENLDEKLAALVMHIAS